MVSNGNDIYPLWISENTVLGIYNIFWKYSIRTNMTLLIDNTKEILCQEAWKWEWNIVPMTQLQYKYIYLDIVETHQLRLVLQKSVTMKTGSSNIRSDIVNNMYTQPQLSNVYF